MEARRTDEVRIELRQGIVSIPWSSYEALLEQLRNRDSLSDAGDVREAFSAVETTRLVRLTDPQKLALRNVISFWSIEEGGPAGLPDGIHALRSAVHDDLLVVGVPEEGEQDLGS